MLALSVSAIIGAGAAAALLWDYGVAFRLLGVVGGGSAAAFGCALYIGAVRSRQRRQIEQSEDVSLLSQGNRTLER